MSSSDSPLPAISAHQIAIRLHPSDKQSDGLDVSVFTAKLNALVAALSAADRAINGKKIYTYKLSKLASSSPTALISEVIPHGKRPLFALASPVQELGQRTSDAIEGRTDTDSRFDPIYRQLARLSAGANEQYEYGELWTSSRDAYRIDRFLEERAQRAERRETYVKLEEGARRHFEGVAIGNFEGMLDYVDLRGSLPAIKLTMLIGGKQLDCVCKSVDTEKIRAALHMRAVVTGRAIYDGSGPLPRRVEVMDIRVREAPDDFSIWKGSVKTFDVAAFGDDDGE